MTSSYGPWLGLSQCRTTQGGLGSDGTVTTRTAVIGTAIDAGWADSGEGEAGVEDEACRDAITTGLVEVGKSLEMFFAF